MDPSIFRFTLNARLSFFKKTTTKLKLNFPGRKNNFKKDFFSVGAIYYFKPFKFEINLRGEGEINCKIEMCNF